MPSLRSTVLIVIGVAVPAQGQQRAPAPARPPTVSGSVTSVTIQQRMIIRVPRLPTARLSVAGASAPAAPPPTRWIEKKTDKCVPAVSLAAAAVTGGDSVDLLLNGGKRLRARFGAECPALDFYSGFYVRMTKDGKICSGRDSVRARSGGECRIKSFKALVPAK